MNVLDLRMKIEELIEEHGEEACKKIEVRTMSQPSWPFENYVSGIISLTDLNDHLKYEEGSSFQPSEWRRGDNTDHPGEVLYIMEGGQAGYGCKDAWEVRL